MYDTEEQKEIDRWENNVLHYIKNNGEFHGCNPATGQNFVIEPDCYRADDSVDGYRGWWIKEQGMTCHADSPFELYIDLLDCEP